MPPGRTPKNPAPGRTPKNPAPAQHFNPLLMAGKAGQLARARAAAAREAAAASAREAEAEAEAAAREAAAASAREAAAAAREAAAAAAAAREAAAAAARSREEASAAQVETAATAAASIREATAARSREEASAAQVEEAAEQGRITQKAYMNRIREQIEADEIKRIKKAEKRKRQLARQPASIEQGNNQMIVPRGVIAPYNGRRLIGSNLNLYNIITESTVDWYTIITRAMLRGKPLMVSINTWGENNNYIMSIAHSGSSSQDLVINFAPTSGRDPLHFTFHSTPFSEENRTGQGAFHVKRNNQLLVRYFTKDYNPIKFIRSPLRVGRATNTELSFIDGVYDIINQYEIRGIQKHADTEAIARAEDIKRDAIDQARLAAVAAAAQAAAERAAKSRATPAAAKPKGRGGTRKNRRSNRKTRKLRR